MQKKKKKKIEVVSRSEDIVFVRLSCLDAIMQIERCRIQTHFFLHIYLATQIFRSGVLDCTSCSLMFSACFLEGLIQKMISSYFIFYDKLAETGSFFLFFVFSSNDPKYWEPMFKMKV